MMRDQTHEQVQPLLAIYRELNPQQQQRLEAHLAQCAVCAQELADFQAMDHQLNALRVQLQHRFQQRQPDRAGLLAQIEAAARPGGRLTRFLAPPLRLATGVAGVVFLLALAGLLAAWFSALSRGDVSESGPPLAGEMTATAAVTGTPARAIEPALQALQEAGAAVTAAPNERLLNQFDDLFTSDVSDLYVATADGEQLTIYVFDDEAGANAAAATIGRSADSLTLETEAGSSRHVALDYPEGVTPRYWQSGAFLIYYTGQAQATLTLLDNLFGPRIADGDLPGQPDRPGQGMAGGEWQGVALQYDPYLAYDLRPEWRPSAAPQQLWLHLESLNLHESAFTPALVISPEPIDVAALAGAAPLTEAETLSFQNGSGARRLVEIENGETVYVAEGESSDGALYVLFYYPVLATEDGYTPQPALLDALFSSLLLPDVLELPEATPAQATATEAVGASCAAVPRPALVLARQIELDGLHLTVLDPLSGAQCTVRTNAYSVGDVAFIGDVLYYPVRDRAAGTMTVWRHPLDGEPAPLPFTATPAINAPWFGLAVSPNGEELVWATFDEPGEAGARFRSAVWLGNLTAETATLLWQEDEPDTFPATVELLHFSAEEELIYFARQPYGIGGVGPYRGRYAGLFALPLDGGEPQPVFECDSPFSMCLNDVDFQRRLLATATDEEQPEVRILDFDGALVATYAPPQADYVGNPLFAPDGAVAFIAADLVRYEDGGRPHFRRGDIRLWDAPSSYAGEPRALVEATDVLFGLHIWLDSDHLVAGDWNDGQGLALLSRDGGRIALPDSGRAEALLVLRE